MKGWSSLLLFPVSMLPVAATAQKQPLKTVSQVNLQRYSGAWYEIARMPNHWESQCMNDVVVHYELKPDGEISVSNDCIKKNVLVTKSNGNAKVVDKNTDAKLKVVFFWPFSADYWIIGLDPEYQWAIVGQPDRKYLWVISRTPTLTSATMDKIRNKIVASGYNVNQLLTTPQDGTNQRM